MSWIERIKSNITPTRKASIPEGVWTMTVGLMDLP